MTNAPILTERNAAGAHIVPTPARRTLAQLAQEAIDVQDACNLSGVALGFGRAIAELRGHIGGGDALRAHPITLLWIDKLADMTGRKDPLDVWTRENNAHDAALAIITAAKTEAA